VRRGGKIPAGEREAALLTAKLIKFIALFVAVALLAACGSIFENGNLKIKDNGEDIVSIGRDGFKLSGNVTGLNLDSDGLHIQYPNGSIAWDDAGFDVEHADGSIRIAGGKMVVTDKDGKKKTLDTAGQGAEYRTDGGALVRTGKKASIPGDFPLDKAPLMEGFELNASAELGSVEVVSGFVPGETVDSAVEYYQPILNAGSSYSRDEKDGGAVLRAKLDGTDITVYITKSLSSYAVNLSVVAGK
jgi:hypothetical protein